MVKKLRFLFTLLIINNALVYCQTSDFKITGKVFAKSENIENVNVILITVKDSTVVKSVLSDAIGNYEILNIKPGNYRLSFIKTGYQTVFTDELQLNQKGLGLTIPLIEIIKQPKQLKEVVVQAKIPYIERRAGKTVINVENSVFGLGSSGLEVLQTVPGIRIENNDQLSIQGKNNVAVYIDGKPSNLSGINLVEFLKNIPTNNIEQIELLNGSSARYDAANNGGIINIKFKKGKNIGANGTASFGGGLGRNYRYNAGLSLNNRTEKSNIYFNYDFSEIKAVDDNYLRRNINNPSLKTLFDIKNNDLKTRTNHNFLLGLDYNLNKNHAVGFLVNAFSNKMLSDEHNKSLIFNNSIQDSTILSTSLENRRINNISTNINYAGNLGKKGTSLKADVDYLNYARKSDENLGSIYLDNNGFEFKSPLQFNNLSPSQIDILSIKADISNPINKNSSLDAGLKSSWVKTSSQRNINITSGQNYIFNPSTLFNYKEQIYAGFISFKTKTEKSNLEIGLRAEQTIAKGDTSLTTKLIDRNYLNLFPNLLYALDFNQNHKISFSFSRGITRPRYEDLNPFYYFLDQYTYNQGNPSLSPSYINASKINWEIKSKYNFSLQYNYIKDFAYVVYEQDNATQTATTSRNNFDYRQTLGFEIGIPITLASWWDIDFNTQAYYEFFKYTNNQKKQINNESTSFLVTLNHTLTLPKGFNAMANMHYESPTSYGIFTFKPLYYVNFGISKSILNKQGSIRFLATDLFDTNSNRYGTNFYNLDLNAKEKAETRSFRLSFSYKFGKKEVKAYRQRKVGAAEEKSRVGQ
ncbi:TonB-dependent receptor [Pedobacter cryophilus]|uniref:TonB-dependent receptor n=1 Tax=Pedobacter cryophilus TaxID=2571271 RepID=A0A4U1C4Q6_9SPHI|nr:TonB-dependent receptor [Pedobacter cryophilus]TKC00349.1 TonB-dependent receptor [Pedobacter cryophilus]